MKTLLISFAFAAVAFSASAADTVTGQQFRDVCASPAVKSAKLNAACATDNPPEAVKAGDRFKAVGIGAELNALAANLKFFVKG